MLMPKRAKYRKQFRGKMKGKTSRGSRIIFGDYALKALTSGWLSSRRIEAGRKALTRYTQKGGRVWIRIFPDKPVSDKPPEVRMGGGKGDVVGYVAVVKPGRIIYEISGVVEDQAKEALSRAANKLGIKTKIIRKG